MRRVPTAKSATIHRIRPPPECHLIIQTLLLTCTVVAHRLSDCRMNSATGWPTESLAKIVTNAGDGPIVVVSVDASDIYVRTIGIQEANSGSCVAQNRYGLGGKQAVGPTHAPHPLPRTFLLFFFFSPFLTARSRQEKFPPTGASR